MMSFDTTVTARWAIESSTPRAVPCIWALTPSGAFNEVGYYGQADAIKALFEASTRRVLELACGKGFNCNYLAARNADIDFFGIDVVERHLTTAQKQAKGLANVHYVAADFQTLPFSDGFF